MATDSTELFEEYRRSGRRSIRNRIVEEHMGLAIHIARGFENRSRRDRDIEQVAMLALVKAVDRFDVTIGVPFTAFAGRTIEGEIKRYFRDSTWAVKVPRGAKELNVAVRRAIDELSVESGRSPTVDEVAAHLGIDRDDVVTGLAADTARALATIEPSSDEDAGGDRLGATASFERGFGDIDDQEAVRALLDDAAGARAQDPRVALLPRHVAIGDRPGGRAVADARVALAAGGARAAPRPVDA